MRRYYWYSGGTLTVIRDEIDVQYANSLPYDRLPENLGFPNNVSTDEFGSSMKSRPNVYIYEPESKAFRKIGDIEAQFLVIWELSPDSISCFYCTNIFGVVDVLKNVRDYKQCLDDLLQ